MQDKTQKHTSVFRFCRKGANYDIYTDDNKSDALCLQAYEGQTDQSNVPYVFHPYHLAEQMDDEISCTVALLHDVWRIQSLHWKI